MGRRGAASIAISLFGLANAQNEGVQVSNGGKPGGPMGIDVGSKFIEPHVTTTDTNGVDGHTTYRLTVSTVGDQAKSIYAIYGDKGDNLSMPPCYHVPAPFGVNIGGTNPAFWQVKPEVKYDSWLTVGVTTGNVHNDISSIGIDWDSWTEKAGLTVDDGAVFWMDPDNGPNFMDGDSTADPPVPVGEAIVGQLTLATGAKWNDGTMTMSAQGRSSGDAKDWDQTHISFTFPVTPPTLAPGPPATIPATGRGSGTPPAPPTPAAVPPVVHHRGPAGCSEVQQVMVTRCVSDCDQCQTHMHAYLTVVGDCLDTSKNDGTSAGKNMQLACPNRPQPPPPPTTPPPPPAWVKEPPPPPPAPAPKACTVATLQATFSAIQQICCGDEASCANSMPTTCNQQCSDLVLDFRDRCQDLLDSMPGGFSSFDDFVALCEAPPAPKVVNGKMASNVAGLIGSMTSGAAHVPTYKCTYQEIMGIALECSSATTRDVLSSSFCTSSCAAKLLPFGQQCAASMGASLAVFGLQDTVSEMATACGDSEANQVDCPLQKILTDCEDVQGAGSASNMCNTPCVQTITAHYDACKISQDPAVTRMFSAGSWGPLISVCNEQTKDAMNDPEADIVTQCSEIQADITKQLSSLCCTDPLCAAMPTKCKHQCSSVLLPFYHDCASELMASSPELMARLTGLASICANGEGH